MKFTQNNRWLFLFFLFVLVLAVLPSVVSAAEAQAAGFKALDTIVDTFANSAKSWVYYFQSKALKLFWPLATVAFFLMVIPHLFRLDLAGLISELVRFLITTGFFYWLIRSVSPLRPDDINLLDVFTKSFTQMAAEATGNIAPDRLSPSNIVGIGLSLIAAALRSVSWWSDTAGGMIVVLSAILVAVIFVFIAGKMTVLLIELWIKAYISPFVLGFGAWSGTRDIAMNYIRSMIALGLKVMTYGLIIGVGQSIVLDACAKVAAPRTIKLPTGASTLVADQVTTNIITHNDILAIMSIGLLLLIISETIPNFIAGLIGNAGSSGASAITIGSTMAVGRTAAGAVTGSAGTVAAGVASAANLARQTAAQSQAGEGILFKGLPGSGESGILKSFAKAKGTAGVGGMAAYGASFGLGVVKNAISGLATTATMGGERTSVGTFDAAVKLNTAREDNRRKIKAGPTSSEGADSQANSQAMATGGKISGASTSDNAPSISESVQSAWAGTYSGSGSMIQAIQNAWQSGNMMSGASNELSPSQSKSAVGKSAPDSQAEAPGEPPPLPQEEQ